MACVLRDSDFGILVLTVLKALAILVPLLIGMAYLTYVERKVLAAMQLRKAARTWSGRSACCSPSPTPSR